MVDIPRKNFSRNADIGQTGHLWMGNSIWAALILGLVNVRGLTYGSISRYFQPCNAHRNLNAIGVDLDPIDSQVDQQSWH